jgi:membrane protease YdiL (CAAX protease family)
MKELKINHLAVLVAIVLQFALGFLWYSVLFQEAWMNSVGLDMATIEADPAGAEEWITNLVSAVVSMYALAWLFTKMNVDTLLKGCLYGLLIGFSFVLLSVMTSGMFAKNPYGLAWITAGFTTVGLGVGGAVLGAWKKYRA